MLNIKDVKPFWIPRYQELRVSAIWELVKKVPNLVSISRSLARVSYQIDPSCGVCWETLRNEAWQELFQNARKSRSSDVEEDNNEMIEIHLTMLDKLMKIQNISKGSSKFEDWIIFNYRERTHRLSFEKVFCIKEYKKEPKGVPSWSRVVKRK